MKAEAHLTIDPFKIDQSESRHSFSQLHVGVGRDVDGKATQWLMRSEFLAHLNAQFLSTQTPTPDEISTQTQTFEANLKLGRFLDIEDALFLLRYRYPDLHSTLTAIFIQQRSQKEVTETSVSRSGTRPTVQTINSRKQRALKLLRKWCQDAANQTTNQSGS